MAQRTDETYGGNFSAILCELRVCTVTAQIEGSALNSGFLPRRVGAPP